MASTPSFVLLHGAGTGAWVWERVARRLTPPVFALDVPGRTPGATPEQASKEIEAQLDRQRVGTVVLVLHSLAGVLASSLAERLGSRLQHLIYVSAVVPSAGAAFVDALPAANGLILRLLFRFRKSGLKPSPSMIRRELCNDLSEEDTALVVARFEAEFPGLYLTRVGAPPTVPGVYVRLLRDQSVPPQLQDAICARLPNLHIEDLDAGHLAMLSQPDRLADVLTRSVQDTP